MCRKCEGSAAAVDFGVDCKSALDVCDLACRVFFRSCLFNRRVCGDNLDIERSAVNGCKTFNGCVFAFQSCKSVLKRFGFCFAEHVVGRRNAEVGFGSADGEVVIAACFVDIADDDVLDRNRHISLFGQGFGFHIVGSRENVGDVGKFDGAFGVDNGEGSVLNFVSAVVNVLFTGNLHGHAESKVRISGERIFGEGVNVVTAVIVVYVHAVIFVAGRFGRNACHFTFDDYGLALFGGHVFCPGEFSPLRYGVMEGNGDGFAFGVGNGCGEVVGNFHGCFFVNVNGNGAVFVFDNLNAFGLTFGFHFYGPFDRILSAVDHNGADSVEVRRSCFAVEFFVLIIQIISCVDKFLRSFVASREAAEAQSYQQNKNKYLCFFHCFSPYSFLLFNLNPQGYPRRATIRFFGVS